MNCEIIAVGTEILLGDILNTNAQYLSRELSALGVSVFHQCVVGDNEQRLIEAIKTSYNRSDMIILTGGLGPTEDDITKETVAKALSINLVYHKESYERIVEYFKNRYMSPTNEKQAYVLENSTVLQNNNGTAPGCLYEQNGKTVVILPGPPFEMQPMFEDYVKPFIMKKNGGIIKSKFIRVFGIGESNAEYLLKDIIQNQTNPTVAPYAKKTESTFRITAKANNENEADSLITDMSEKIYNILGDAVYGEDDDTLQSVLVKLLQENSLKISFAESCTAGLIASKIGEISGASDVFCESYITYSNEAKHRLVDVDERIIAEYGAVSSQTAIAMANGVRSASCSDIGISVTGISGPTGGSKEKPVGLTYIGVSYMDISRAYKFVFKGDRNKNRELAAYNALNIARLTILGKDVYNDLH
ncbi:MAG: competence/damage-inducible protein A [Clostridia bacterium]|nr:competence/damage-inducible protein A [Clostridia bacterium]